MLPIFPTKDRSVGFQGKESRQPELERARENREKLKVPVPSRR